MQITEALARDGQRDRAFAIVRLTVSGDWADDKIQLRWIEHLIASRDFDSAAKAIGAFRKQKYHVEALRQLAAAYARHGESARAMEVFNLAIAAAVRLEHDFARVDALRKIGDTQLAAGKRDEAIATARLLADRVEFKESRAKFLALRDSAVLAAKAGEKKMAVRLFERAIDTSREVGETNREWKVELTDLAQASVGYFVDARKTGARNDFVMTRLLYAIAQKQLESDDVDGAIHTVLSMKHNEMRRTDMLEMIVQYLIDKRDLKRALSIAGEIDGGGPKAAAVLNVATAYARSGDRKTAVAIAARIDLAAIEFGRQFEAGRPDHFDYRIPRSWGNLYLPIVTGAGI